MRKKTNDNRHQQGTTLQALSKVLNNTIQQLKKTGGLVDKALNDRELFAQYQKGSDKSELVNALTKHTNKLVTLFESCSLNGALLMITNDFIPDDDLEDKLLDLENTILQLLSAPYDGYRDIKSRKLNDVVERTLNDLKQCLGLLRQYHYLRDNECEKLMPFLGIQKDKLSSAINQYRNSCKYANVNVKFLEHTEDFLFLCTCLLEKPKELVSFYAKLTSYQNNYKPKAQGSPRTDIIKIKENNFCALNDFINYVQQTYTQHMAKLHILNPKNLTICGLLSGLTRQLQQLFYTQEDKSVEESLAKKINALGERAKKNKCYLSYSHKLTTEVAQTILRDCYKFELQLGYMKYHLENDANFKLTCPK